jgi:phytol kinase
MILLLLITTSAVFIGAAEVLKRKFALPTAFTRRAAHIGTATVAGIAPLYVGKIEIIIVSLLFAVAFYIGRQYRVFSAVHSVERRTFGEIYLPLGVVTTAFLFLPQYVTAFQYGIFIMGVSDAVAGFVGEKFGKHHYFILKNKKSIEGSFAFLIASVGLTYVFVPMLGYQLLLVPLLLTLVEAVLIFGLDNVVVPLAAAGLYTYFFL